MRIASAWDIVDDIEKNKQLKIIFKHMTINDECPQKRFRINENISVMRWLGIAIGDGDVSLNPQKFMHSGTSYVDTTSNNNHVVRHEKCFFFREVMRFNDKMTMCFHCSSLRRNMEAMRKRSVAQFQVQT